MYPPVKQFETIRREAAEAAAVTLEHVPAQHRRATHHFLPHGHFAFTHLHTGR